MKFWLFKNVMRLTYKCRENPWWQCCFDDNLNSLHSFGLKNIHVKFLLLNSVSVLQRMDQGVIKVIKRCYKKCLIQQFLNDMEWGKNAQISSANLLDAMHYLSTVWVSVKFETISNCFWKDAFSEQRKVALKCKNFRVTYCLKIGLWRVNVFGNWITQRIHDTDKGVSRSELKFRQHYQRHKKDTFLYWCLTEWRIWKLGWTQISNCFYINWHCKCLWHHVEAHCKNSNDSRWL